MDGSAFSGYPVRFLRLATLHFDPFPPDVEPLTLETGDVMAHGRKIESADGNPTFLVQAETPLVDLLPRDDEGYISVPESTRRRCEAVIEIMANLIAVTGRCRRSICSPSPPASFLAENEDDRRFLSECRGVRSQRTFFARFVYPIALTNDLAAALLDRTDGVALFAEAISHNLALAQYRDFVRLFELAFAEGSSKQEKKLAQFLSDARVAGRSQGYTRDEVHRWLSLRHGASHADLLKTKHIVLEADVRPIVARMEQAALDVLFNKSEWRTSSAARRQVLKLLAGTTEPDLAASAIVGTRFSLHAQLMDDFCVYPHARVALTPLDDCWWKTPDGGPSALLEAPPLNLGQGVQGAESAVMLG